MGCDSPCNSPNKAISMELATNPSSSTINCNDCQQINHCDEVVPSPHHISDIELKVLQACLKRWRKETENSVRSKLFY